MKRLFRGMFVAGVAAATMTLAGAAPAFAGDATSVTIGAGDAGTPVGTAAFTRTSSPSSDTLVIRLSVPGGIDASHVCLQSQPFVGRVAPGQCPYSQAATGANATYSIDLGASYSGKAVYVQASTVTNGNTAFAGWQSGQPFYGNVVVAADATSLPIAAIGTIGLTLLLSAFGWGVLRRRTGNRSHAGSHR
jgi:hypothetical protein